MDLRGRLIFFWGGRIPDRQSQSYLGERKNSFLVLLRRGFKTDERVLGVGFQVSSVSNPRVFGEVSLSSGRVNEAIAGTGFSFIFALVQLDCEEILDVPARCQQPSWP